MSLPIHHLLLYLFDLENVKNIYIGLTSFIVFNEFLYKLKILSSLFIKNFKFNYRYHSIFSLANFSEFFY